MANAVVDGETVCRPSSSLDQSGPAASSSVDDPPFTHNYPHGHPTVRFTGVEVPEDAVVGGVGGGDDLQRVWFTEERLGIAARGVGSCRRLLEEATAWALEREQGGSRIMDYQGVSFPLADSAADAAAGRLLRSRWPGSPITRSRPQDRPREGVHGQAVRERGGLACADRCVQIFGGHGYMRTNVRSDSCASCASTASGRARARSSA